MGHSFLLGLAKTVFLHCPVLHVSTRVEKQVMCVTNPNVEKFCHLARKNLLSVDRWINIEFNWICFIVLYFPFFCRILCKSHGWTNANRIYTAVKRWSLHSIPRLSNIKSSVPPELIFGETSCVKLSWFLLFFGVICIQFALELKDFSPGIVVTLASDLMAGQS